MSFPHCTLLITLIAICVGCSIDSVRDPDPTRQPWRDSWDALPSAKTGDAEGLHRFFAAAEAQVELPYVNGGEDAEAIWENMEVVLDLIGDLRFAEALLRERSQTQSAVREFLSEEKVREGFPKTFQILVEAPVVIWPSDRAEAQLYAEYGDELPPKEHWTR